MTNTTPTPTSQLTPKEPQPLSAYKAIFFDAGDTLITVPGDRNLFGAFLARYSLIREEEAVGQALKNAIHKHYVNKPLAVDELCSPESDRLYWMSIYHDVLLELGADREWNEAELEAVCSGLYEEFLKPSHYELFPDVIRNLERLKQEGFRLGLVSNFSSGLRAILEDKGILPFFDPVVISVEAGMEKPNPNIFKLALSLAKLEPSDVLYVGDHEVNDVWAPAQVGIDSRRIKRYDYHKGEGIHSLDELV